MIEDNEDAADMLRQVLQMASHELAVAGHGRQGLAMARELVPDVILCDLGLPGGMSGFDVARKLRADEHARSIRLVALSGDGRPEDQARGAEAGFDAHLTKPVDAKALHQVLEELVRLR